MLNELFITKYHFLVNSILLLGLYVTVRFILIKSVKGWGLKDGKNKQTWLFIARQIPNLILVIGILIIWGPALRNLALSLVAVAAAIVVATKEVILCFMGGLLKASTKLFEIDDRISVSGIRGKVKEHNLMTTELLEIGPGPKSNQTTGKIIKLPNSVFLTNYVSIVPSENDFITHLISITLPIDNLNLEKIESSLLSSAEKVTKTFQQKFDVYKKTHPKDMDQFDLAQGPKIFVDFNAKDSFEISLRMSIPYDGMSIIENDIKKDFMRRLESLKNTEQKPS